jgi:hypothetical protein
MAHEHSVFRTLRAVEDDYSPDDDRPLGSLLAVLTTYGVLATSVVGAATRVRRDISWGDIVRVGVATANIARTIAKDPVTSPLRAPFTRFTGELDGPAELREEVRGTGPRKAIGELVECPFCVTPWVATALFGLHVASPRSARFVSGIFVAATISDFLQYATAASQQHT